MAEERKLLVQSSMFQDTHSEDLRDVAGDRIHRLYVYEMHSKKELYGFVQPNTTTVVSLDNNFKSNDNQHNLLKENDEYYFEVILEAIESEQLDFVNGTSLTGQSLSKELAVTAISNQKINTEVFNSLVVTIDTPLDESKYNNNEQEVYLIASTSSSELADYEKGTENLYSVMQLANLKILEAQATNSQILITKNKNLKTALFLNDKDQAEFRLKTNPETLFDSIKAKGEEFTENIGEMLHSGIKIDRFGTFGIFTTLIMPKANFDVIKDEEVPVVIEIYRKKKTETTRTKVLNFDLFDKQDHVKQLLFQPADIQNYEYIFDVRRLNETDKEETDIDLLTKNFIVPIKMTPTSIKDKVMMTCEWFDESKTIPYEVVEKFNGGKTLKEIITNTDDLHLVEDMVALAFLIVSQYESMPLIQDVSNVNVGKFDPAYGIGHNAIPVSRTEGKSIELLDGLYETHIRRHPSFEADGQRKMLVDGIINALCRYIFTTYTIATGNNTYGWAYLPWFLVPFDKTSSVLSGISLKQIDAPTGHPGITKTYVLDETIKWFPKTVYFNEQFSKDGLAKVGDITNKAKWHETSEPISVKTDRRMTLPEVPYQLTEMSVPGVTGAVDIRNNDGLSYIWKVPLGVVNYSKFKNLMAGTKVLGKAPAGTDILFSVPKPAEGTFFADDAAKEVYIKAEAAKEYNVNVSNITSVTIPASTPEPSEVKVFDATWHIVGSNTTNEIDGDWADQPNQLGNYYIDKYAYDFAWWAKNNQIWGRNQKLQDIIIDDYSTINLITPGKEQRQFILKYLADKLHEYKSDSEGNTYSLFYDKNTTNSWASLEAQVSKHITILTSTLDFFTYDESGTTRDVVGLKGAVRFQILTDTFSAPSTITLNVEVGKEHTFSDRKIEFDKSDWEDYIVNTVGKKETELILTSTNTRKIDSISVLTITSMWADHFILQNYRTDDSIKIPAMNKFDETITTQHILFI